MSPEIGFNVVPPAHQPWDPDDNVDFHAARLLVLMRRCGEGASNRIEGRTKLAKLDFFVRYPAFLERARNALSDAQLPAWQAAGLEVEAPMIRYRFGPWDTRYRQYLVFLESRKLIKVSLTKPERVSLTASGRRVADELVQVASFQPIVDRCDAMAGNLANLNGTTLKNLIYDLFPVEVGELPMRKVIAT